jgi:hypothetical protein
MTGTLNTAFLSTDIKPLKTAFMVPPSLSVWCELS